MTSDDSEKKLGDYTPIYERPIIERYPLRPFAYPPLPPPQPPCMPQPLTHYIQVHERNFKLTQQAQALLYKLQVSLQNNPGSYGKMHRIYLKARIRYNRRFCAQLNAR